MPGSEAPTPEQVILARQHERELQPLRFEQTQTQQANSQANTPALRTQGMLERTARPPVGSPDSPAGSGQIIITDGISSGVGPAEGISSFRKPDAVASARPLRRVSRVVGARTQTQQQTQQAQEKKETVEYPAADESSASIEAIDSSDSSDSSDPANADAGDARVPGDATGNISAGEAPAPASAGRDVRAASSVLQPGDFNPDFNPDPSLTTTAPAAASLDDVGDPQKAIVLGVHQTQADANRLPIAQPPDEPFWPAKSDSDSPARGIPKPIDDPGKKITGGFGDVGEAQYYPLDGAELKTLIEALMDDMYARLQDDLRFSPAICYPRVTARVVVEVQAFVADQAFQIQKVMIPHERTPVDVARAYGDEVVFCVISERQEMTADGESVVPPDKTRLELGLEVPRKQAVQTPGGRVLVDRRS